MTVKLLNFTKYLIFTIMLLIFLSCKSAYASGLVDWLSVSIDENGHMTHVEIQSWDCTARTGRSMQFTINGQTVTVYSTRTGSDHRIYWDGDVDVNNLLNVVSPDPSRNSYQIKYDGDNLGNGWFLADMLSWWKRDGYSGWTTDASTHYRSKARVFYTDTNSWNSGSGRYENVSVYLPKILDKGSHSDNDGDGSCDACGYQMTRTVAFDGNGGTTPDPAAVTVKYNTAIPSIPSSSRDGYTFLGWYTDSTDGTRVDADTKITQNCTLYAHWQIKTYRIKYILHGFTFNNPVTEYTVEDEIKIPAAVSTDPSKKKFKKWISYEAGAGDLMPGCKNIGYKNNVMTIPKGTYGNLTFEVDWKPVGEGICSSETVVNHFRIKV